MSKEPDTAECVESPLRTQGLIATRCIETSEAGVEQQQQKQCDRDPSIASHRTEANVSGSMRTGDVPTVAHSTIHPPSIQWSQNKDSVFLNIRNAAEAADTSSVCTMSCDFQSTSLEALDKPHTADTLRIVLGSQAVELQLFSLFVLQDSSVKACRDSWTVKVVLKKETDATWPRLTKSAEKHHFVSLDWSKWNEDCDESSLNDAIPSNVPIAEGTPVTLPDGRLVRVPPLAPFGDYGSEVMEIQTADCQTIPDATVPPLKSLLADDENLKSNARQFWVSSLTTAQKLHTLTEMWNAVPSSNRGVCFLVFKLCTTNRVHTLCIKRF